MLRSFAPLAAPGRRATVFLASLVSLGLVCVLAASSVGRPIGTAAVCTVVLLAVLGCLAVGVPAVASGTLDPVMLAVTVLVPLAAFEATSALGPASAQLVASAGAAVRIVSLVESAEASTAALPAPRHLRPAPDGGPVLVARDLAVGWPGGPVVARGIDLELRPGRRLAVVGPSGVGKTTLAQGVGEALGVRGRVTSPTFVIARVHPALGGGPDLVHVDDAPPGGETAVPEADAVDGNVDGNIGLSAALRQLDTLNLRNELVQVRGDPSDGQDGKPGGSAEQGKEVNTPGQGLCGKDPVPLFGGQEDVLERVAANGVPPGPGGGEPHPCTFLQGFPSHLQNGRSSDVHERKNRGHDAQYQGQSHDEDRDFTNMPSAAPRGALAAH